MLEAVLFGPGDAIMAEETEEKVGSVTVRAELHPGMVDVIRRLHRRGVPLGIAADTRDGTCWNALGMHGIMDLFSVFAIPEHLGVEKPDRRMFLRALEGFGIPEERWRDVVMVGTTLGRDVRGTNAVGLVTVWLVWNPRYPLTCADDDERSDFQVSTADSLWRLLAALAEGHDPSAWAHPQLFPRDVTLPGSLDPGDRTHVGPLVFAQGSLSANQSHRPGGPHPLASALTGIAWSGMLPHRQHTLNG